MTVGLPGASIGGLFYVLSALFMPLRELFRRVARPGERRFWRRALGQSGIALGIVGVTWGIGWMLGWVIVRGVVLRRVILGSAGAASPAPVHTGLWSMIALLLALITLTLVLIGVQMLRLLVRRPGLSVLPSGVSSNRVRIPEDEDAEGGLARRAGRFSP